MNQTKTVPILLTIIAVLFVSILVVLTMNLSKNQPTPAKTDVALTPTIVPTIAVAPTTTSISSIPSDWKIFENKEFGFSLQTPASINVNNLMNDQYNRNVDLKGDDINLHITLKNSPNDFDLSRYYYMDNTKFKTTTLGGQTANVYEFPNGYCDGPGCSAPFVAVVTEHNKNIYSLSFFGVTKLSNTENQILSTLQFIDIRAEGKITGNLCYPSSGIPAGKIIAKNINTKEEFTQNYTGSSVSKTSYYFIPVPAGTYHVKFGEGYYTNCDGSYGCDIDANHKNLDVLVNSGQTVTGVNPCDFYYNTPEQKTMVESSF